MGVAETGVCEVVKVNLPFIDSRTFSGRVSSRVSQFRHINSLRYKKVFKEDTLIRFIFINIRVAVIIRDKFFSSIMYMYD